MYSLVIPVYKNEGCIPELVQSLRHMGRDLGGKLEVVFVVDGSPDQSFARLRDALPDSEFSAKVLLLSRNFGSFAAIRAGLSAASGPYFAVMAADLQEPPALVLEFFRSLSSEPIDVVIGVREGRADPPSSRLAAQIFWSLYREFIVPEMPAGGVDVFGCNQTFRDQLLRMEESHSSLIALLFWLGFRRKEVSYQRVKRRHGVSAWTLQKKVNYLMDSMFAFSDLPIKLLLAVGGLGLGVAFLLGLLTVIARVTGWIGVPGYAATVLVVMFFGALNMFSLGLVGSYAWRTYENTKRRPLAIIMSISEYDKGPR